MFKLICNILATMKFWSTASPSLADPTPVDDSRVKCKSCGRVYVCSPLDDYYNHTNNTNGVCSQCLITSAFWKANHANYFWRRQLANWKIHQRWVYIIKIDFKTAQPAAKRSRRNRTRWNLFALPIFKPTFALQHCSRRRGIISPPSFQAQPNGLFYLSFTFGDFCDKI